MLFPKDQGKSSVNRNQSELDQSLLKELERLLDCTRGTAERKYHARVIIESLVDFLFVKHFLRKEFNELMTKREAQKNDNKKQNIKGEWLAFYDINKFLDCAKYLIVELRIVPEYHQNGITFIWTECSAYGAHMPPDSDGGIAEYVDSIILSIKPLLEWYYYNYRHFNKSDLKLERMFSEYFDDRLPFLNKKPSKFTVALTVIAPILLALSLLLASYLHKYNSLYQDQLDINRRTQIDCMSAMQVLKDSIKRSAAVTDSHQANTISNNSVGGDIVTGTKKIENNVIKYNTEKGNMYNLPAGNVTINK